MSAKRKRSSRPLKETWPDRLRLLGFWLRVMGYDQPAAVRLFLVDIRHQVIVLDCSAVLHRVLPALQAHLPSEIPIDVNTLIQQQALPRREALVVVYPVFLLRIPPDNDRFAARADKCDVGGVGLHLLHGRAIVDHLQCRKEGFACRFHPFQVPRRLGERAVRAESNQRGDQHKSAAYGHAISL